MVFLQPEGLYRPDELAILFPIGIEVFDKALKDGSLRHLKMPDGQRLLYGAAVAEWLNQTYAAPTKTKREY